MLELRRPQLHVGTIPDTGSFRGLAARAPGRLTADCSERRVGGWGLGGSAKMTFQRRLSQSRGFGIHGVGRIQPPSRPNAHPPTRSYYFPAAFLMLSNSMSKTRVAPGGITFPAPLSP